MGLSCSCPDYDGDGWEYYPPDDFTTLQTKRRKRAKRRKRCKSCKELIDINATCLKFDRQRYPNSEIEDRIYGEGGEVDIASWYMCENCGDQYMNLSELGFCVDGEIDIASWYMCENCGDPYMNLSELGFCVDIESNMLDLLKEYQQLKSLTSA